MPLNPTPGTRPPLVARQGFGNVTGGPQCVAVGAIDPLVGAVSCMSTLNSTDISSQLPSYFPEQIGQGDRALHV